MHSSARHSFWKYLFGRCSRLSANNEHGTKMWIEQESDSAVSYCFALAPQAFILFECECRKRSPPRLLHSPNCRPASSLGLRIKRYRIETKVAHYIENANGTEGDKQRWGRKTAQAHEWNCYALIWIIAFNCWWFCGKPAWLFCLLFAFVRPIHTHTHTATRSRNNFIRVLYSCSVAVASNFSILQLNIYQLIWWSYTSSSMSVIFIM